MADINPAKTGDEIALKARKRLGELMGLDVKFIQAKVMPKTPGKLGQWLCVTCGCLPRHNMEACSHMESHKTHKFAWMNSNTGNIEEP